MTMAIGLVLSLFTIMFSPMVPPEVMNGALCAGLFLLLPMGVCSLLSNDYGNPGVTPTKTVREAGESHRGRQGQPAADGSFQSRLISKAA
jgi:hypothetical protein